MVDWLQLSDFEGYENLRNFTKNRHAANPLRARLSERLVYTFKYRMKVTDRN